MPMCVKLEDAVTLCPWYKKWYDGIGMEGVKTCMCAWQN